MRATTPRPIRQLALVLALATVVLLAVVTAGAGDLMGLRTNKRHHGTRLTDAPRLSFTTGVLRQGRHGTWKLDDGTPLRLEPGLQWREEVTGKAGSPSSGRLVMINGQRTGGVLTVRQATLLSKERQLQALQTAEAPAPGQPDTGVPR